MTTVLALDTCLPCAQSPLFIFFGFAHHVQIFFVVVYVALRTLEDPVHLPTRSHFSNRETLAGKRRPPVSMATEAFALAGDNDDDLVAQNNLREINRLSDIYIKLIPN